MHRFLEWHAGDFMARSVVTVHPGAPLRELEALFDRYDFNAFPVVEGERVVGLITKFDFLKAFIFTTSEAVPRYNALMDTPARDEMTTEVIHVESDTPLTHVLELMILHKARSFPVMDGDRRLVGMISREDLMRALRLATRSE